MSARAGCTCVLVRRQSINNMAPSRRVPEFSDCYWRCIYLPHFLRAVTSTTLVQHVVVLHGRQPHVAEFHAITCGGNTATV